MLARGWEEGAWCLYQKKDQNRQPPKHSLNAPDCVSTGSHRVSSTPSSAFMRRISSLSTAIWVKMAVRNNTSGGGRERERERERKTNLGGGCDHGQHTLCSHGHATVTQHGCATFNQNMDAQRSLDAPFLKFLRAMNRLLKFAWMLCRHSSSNSICRFFFTASICFSSGTCPARRHWWDGKGTHTSGPSTTRASLREHTQHGEWRQRTQPQLYHTHSPAHTPTHKAHSNTAATPSHKYHTQTLVYGTTVYP